MNQTVRKLVFFVVVQVIFYNYLYIMFIPEIYNTFWYLIGLGMYYLVTFTDTILRPLQDEERDPEADKFTIILLIVFLLNPFVLIATIVEKNVLIEPYIPQWDQEVISILGLALFTICSLYMLLGRIQLGKYATGKLSIQDKHELIETGLYKYVRNPLYGGSIVGGLFYLIIFNAIVIPIVYTLLLFYVLNQRATYEEKLLQKEFGTKYEEYKKRTKKYIPFVY